MGIHSVLSKSSHIMLARGLLMWWEAGVPFVCLLWPQNKSVVRGLLKGDLCCLWSFFLNFLFLFFLYLLFGGDTFIWIVPVVYLLCLWSKTFAFLSLMAKVQGMVCTGGVSQTASLYAAWSWKYVAQGKYVIETCTTGFTEKWAFDVMTDDFWICIRKYHYLKLLLLCKFTLKTRMLTWKAFFHSHSFMCLITII